MPNDYSQYRYQHTHILGSSGTGKTTLLKKLVLESIQRGEGSVFFDFHGQATDSLLKHIPRPDDVVIFDPRFPTPLNLFDTKDKDLTAIAILDMFRAIAKYSPNLSTPYFDQFILYATHLLFDKEDATLLDLKYILTTPSFRDRYLEHCTDPLVVQFFTKDIDQMKDVYNKMQSVLNKLSLILIDKRIRRIVSYPKSSIDIEDVIQNNKVLLVRLPISTFGVNGARILARIVLAKLYSSCLKATCPFHIFIDQAENLDGTMLEEMLSVVGRYNVSITLANQYLDQLTIKDAVIGNTGTKIAFRLGLDDATKLETLMPGNLHLYWLFELPQWRARVVTPASAKAFELDIEVPVFPTYQQSVKTVRSHALEYRMNKNHVDKHIRRTIDEGSDQA